MGSFYCCTCFNLPAKVRAFLDFAIEHLGGDEPYWDD